MRRKWGVGAGGKGGKDDGEKGGDSSVGLDGG